MELEDAPLERGDIHPLNEREALVFLAFKHGATPSPAWLQHYQTQTRRLPGMPQQAHDPAKPELITKGIRQGLKFTVNAHSPDVGLAGARQFVSGINKLISEMDQAIALAQAQREMQAKNMVSMGDKLFETLKQKK